MSPHHFPIQRLTLMLRFTSLILFCFGLATYLQANSSIYEKFDESGLTITPGVIECAPDSISVNLSIEVSGGVEPYTLQSNFGNAVDGGNGQFIIQNIPVGVSATLTAIDATGCMLLFTVCLLYTSPSPRDATLSRMPSSA